MRIARVALALPLLLAACAAQPVAVQVDLSKIEIDEECASKTLTLKQLRRMAGDLKTTDGEETPAKPKCKLFRRTAPGAVTLAPQ